MNVLVHTYACMHAYCTTGSQLTTVVLHIGTVFPAQYGWTRLIITYVYEVRSQLVEGVRGRAITYPTGTAGFTIKWKSLPPILTMIFNNFDTCIYLTINRSDLMGNFHFPGATVFLWYPGSRWQAWIGQQFSQVHYEPSSLRMESVVSATNYNCPKFFN